MFKKLLIVAVMAVAMMVEMPLLASAATHANNAVTNPQIRVQIGRDRRWRRHDRYDNDYYRRNRMVGRYRLVPQYYWMDGRRYVRYIRVYNF
jgi:Ni/Co efflux regulator RcnB